MWGPRVTPNAPKADANPRSDGGNRDEAMNYTRAEPPTPTYEYSYVNDVPTL